MKGAACVLTRALQQHACTACWAVRQCNKAHLSLCPIACIPQNELPCCTGHLSRLHEEVSGALSSFGVQHTNQHVTQDGLFCVDIALQGGKVRILFLMMLFKNAAGSLLLRTTLYGRGLMCWPLPACSLTG